MAESYDSLIRRAVPRYDEMTSRLLDYLPRDPQKVLELGCGTGCEPESNHRVNWDRWLEFCREPGHCTEEEIESLLEHAAAHDHYVPLSEHVTLLSGAGFVDVDCVWRNLMWGIVTAGVV